MKFEWKALLWMLLAGWLGAAMPAVASEYPSKPIRLVIPFGVGGATDVFGRILAESLRAQLNTPVVTDNVTGVGGVIGASRVASAAADGYTLLFTTNAQVINPALRPKVSFDPIKDFTPLGYIGHSPNFLIVGGQSPVRSVAEYVATAKQSSERLSYASAGVGTSTHLAAEDFSQRAGITLLHVPYASTVAMTNAVMSGEVQSEWLGGQSTAALLKAGRLKALGVAGSKRSRFSPDTPTFQELGYGDFTSVTWFAVFAPRNLPTEVTSRLVVAVEKAMNDPATCQRLLAAGIDECIYKSPQVLETRMQVDLQFYRKLAAERTIRIVD